VTLGRNYVQIILAIAFFMASAYQVYGQDEQPLLKDYEYIVLDGDTVLRSKTGEIKRIEELFAPNPNTTAFIKTDWYNRNWDNKKVDPFQVESLTYPLQIDFTYMSFSTPIVGKVTSRYGWRKGRAHNGIDIDLVTGDNVVAALDGKVRIASYTGGFGRLVVIRHNNGLETFYGHLSKIIVKENDFVRSGQVIGKGGNTGRSRGSHLHFETRYLGKPIHPEYLFDLEETMMIRSANASVSSKWTDARKHRAYKKSTIPLGTSQLAVTATPSPSVPAAAEIVKSEPAPLQKASTSQPANPSNTLEKSKVHVVVRGDTLAKIARKYNTTVDAICTLNGIKKTAIIRIGGRLIVQ